MLPPMMAPLGTITSLLSGVVMVVVKMLMVWITPVAPPASTKSPLVKGRKIISMTPEAKFDRELCSDRPMARPAAPSKAISEVVSMPSWLSAAITTNSNKTQRRIASRKPTRISSILRARSSLPAKPTTTDTTMRPMMNMTRAKNSFMPQGMT